MENLSSENISGNSHGYIAFFILFQVFETVIQIVRNIKSSYVSKLQKGKINLRGENLREKIQPILNEGKKGENWFWGSVKVLREVFWILSETRNISQFLYQKEKSYEKLKIVTGI